MRSRRDWRRSWAALLADPAALRSLTARAMSRGSPVGRLAIAPGSKPRQIGMATQRKASAGGGSHEPARHGPAARVGVAASGGDAAAKMRARPSRGCHCDACAKEGPARPDQDRADAAPPIVRQVLSTAGQPLDTATRGSMETRFGHDFGRVRIHADGKADASARAVGASAYAVGPHIVFARGQYAPATKAGEMVLAHELTHVLQQPAHAGSGEIRLGEAGDAHEREADSIAGAGDGRCIGEATRSRAGGQRRRRA